MWNTATNHFDLVSVWTFEAPADLVWAVIADGEHWPEWWSYVERVEQIGAGQSDGRFSVWRYSWKTLLPYKIHLDLRITRIDPPRLLEADVTGDLVGLGRFRIVALGGQTQVRCEWNVRTGRCWMTWMAPFARPIFAWNHRMVMRAGEVQLAGRLARLRDARAVSLNANSGQETSDEH